MKLKNNILICSILLGVFLSTSCHKDEEDEQVIYEELQGVWDRGDIEITIDGSTWEKKYSKSLHNLNAISFPVSSTGYVAGDWGTILKTMDGGDSWVHYLPI
jgi:photosystem II stability/assembly factor-like uncharacterized protein